MLIHPRVQPTFDSMAAIPSSPSPAAPLPVAAPTGALGENRRLTNVLGAVDTPGALSRSALEASPQILRKNVPTESAKLASDAREGARDAAPSALLGLSGLHSQIGASGMGRPVAQTPGMVGGGGRPNPTSFASTPHTSDAGPGRKGAGDAGGSDSVATPLMPQPTTGPRRTPGFGIRFAEATSTPVHYPTSSSKPPLSTARSVGQGTWIALYGLSETDDIEDVLSRFKDALGGRHASSSDSIRQYKAVYVRLAAYSEVAI